MNGSDNSKFRYNEVGNNIHVHLHSSEFYMFTKGFDCTTQKGNIGIEMSNIHVNSNKSLRNYHLST